MIGSAGSPFDYSPLPARPPLKWPGGARVALWVVPNIEAYQLQPPLNKYRSAWPRNPDVRGYSWRDFGNRVGFWRMLAIFDKYNIPITTSLNMAILDEFPEVGDAIISRNWEIMAHGLYNTSLLFGMAISEERRFIAELMAIHLRHTGQELKGMFGPNGSITPNTMDLMAEAGLLYSADWYVDDQPFLLNVRQGRLVCVPYTWELNDGILMTAGRSPGMGTYEADYFARICREQFDTLYMEGEESGRVMCISLHTSIFGQPYRADYLDEALDYILSHDAVWPASGSQIAEHYLKQLEGRDMVASSADDD